MKLFARKRKITTLDLVVMLLENRPEDWDVVRLKSGDTSLVLNELDIVIFFKRIRGDLFDRVFVGDVEYPITDQIREAVEVWQAGHLARRMSADDLQSLMLIAGEGDQ